MNGSAMTGIAAYARRPGVGVPTYSGMTPLAQPIAVDVHQRIAPMMDMRMGYASGGDVVGAGLDGLNAAQLLQFLVSIGKQRQAAAGQAAFEAQTGFGSNPEGGAAGNTALGGAMSGNTPGSMSSANYGLTAMGMDGLSPGRDLGLGTAGKLAGYAAGQAIPGAGFATGIGNAFNAGTRSAQLADFAGQVAGKQPGPTLGSFLSGAIGMGLGFTDADFGRTIMDRNLNPDQADLALTNGIATGNVNMSPSQMSAMPGFGIAGVAGPAASGFSGVGLGPGSAAAFGASVDMVPGLTGVGNDGTVSFGGTLTSSFGGMDPNGPQAGQEGGQGGSGQAGGDASNANGGGGAGGGDSFARGGTAGRRMRAPDFRCGSGLVHGTSGGREDALSIEVPRGAYVIPADVVSARGGGNTMAGGADLARRMPLVPGIALARGGLIDALAVPIRVSPGEFVVHPAHVDALGGADALDRMVAQTREANIRTLRGMPDPR